MIVGIKDSSLAKKKTMRFVVHSEYFFFLNKNHVNPKYVSIEIYIKGSHLIFISSM